MIKALSYEIERHIHFINLATVESDDQLNKLMSSVDFKNTIIVLEDIDAMSNVTHSRWKKPESDESYNSDNSDNSDNSEDKPHKKTQKHKKTHAESTSKLTLA